MTERKISWPEYRKNVFDDSQASMLLVLSAVLTALITFVIPRLRVELQLAFVGLFVVLVPAVIFGPRLFVRVINGRIRDAWEKNEIGARLEPDEAQAKIAAAPGAYVLRYFHVERRDRSRHGSIYGGWSSFLLEEKATGRRWAIRFPETGRLLAIGDLWKLAGAQIEVMRDKSE